MDLSSTSSTLIQILSLYHSQTSNRSDRIWLFILLMEDVNNRFLLSFLFVRLFTEGPPSRLRQTQDIPFPFFLGLVSGRLSLCLVKEWNGENTSFLLRISVLFSPYDEPSVKRDLGSSFHSFYRESWRVNKG